MLRQRARVAASLAVATAIVLAASAPAQAHNYLVSSTPEAGGILTEAPETFSVTTNEALLNLSEDSGGFAIEVTDADGAFYGDGCTSVDGSTLSTGASLGAAGVYRMLWQLVSADGHTVSGEVDFTWAPPTDTVVSAGVSTPPNCGGDTVTAPDPATATAVRADATLGDVLWIGGAIAAMLVAGLVTLVVARRRHKG